MSSRRILFATCLFVTQAGTLAVVGAPADELVKPKAGPLEMKFVSLPKGTFYMGGGGGKAGEKAEIKEDFEIAIHTVTQAQWQAVMGNNPSWFSRARKGKDAVKDIKDEELTLFPVERVSWVDAQEFIKKLNDNEVGRGYLYRLPTEPEWEYACRGGATSEEECSFDFYVNKATNDLSLKQANFHGPYPYPPSKADKTPHLRRPTKVGSYPPNKLGLYDMHGNICQWCADRYESQDPEAPDNRMVRGGSWQDGRPNRAASRGVVGSIERRETLGFRLVRVRSGGK